MEKLASSDRFAGFLRYLFGSPLRFTLEHRLFNIVAFVNGVANIGGIFAIPDQGGNEWFLICLYLATGLCFIGCYLISRVRGVYQVLFWPFVLLIAVFLGANMLGNAGYQGGAHYYVPVALVIAIILSKGWRSALIASLVFVGLSFALFECQARFPDWFTPHVSEEAGRSDLMLNFLFVQGFLGFLVIVLSKGLNNERRKSDQLLANILPAAIAEELKLTSKVEPRYYETATILFTDTVGFTGIAERLTAHELVTQLDENFGYFDRIILERGVEKIKTIGDAYMAVSGVPEPTPTHALDMILAALQIQHESCCRAALVSGDDGSAVVWRHRIGIHTGPVYAGVIGHTKFAYDIWGDSVNTASRLETESPADGINVSAATAALVEAFVEIEPRGKIAAKNKGEIEMFLVTRLRPEFSSDEAGVVPNKEFWERCHTSE